MAKDDRNRRFAFKGVHPRPTAAPHLAEPNQDAPPKEVAAKDTIKAALRDWAPKVPTIHLWSADDSASLTAEVEAALNTLRVRLVHNSGTLPRPSDRAVGIVVYSDGLTKDTDRVALCAEALDARFPLIVAVRDSKLFNFNELPNEVSRLSGINAKGVTPDASELLLAVKIHLGLVADRERRRVFISYRRAEAESVANKIHDHLWACRYDTFLDTEQLEGGAVVQPRIMKAVEERDFILLLESPSVADSTWVQDELVKALSLRIPVRAVLLAKDSSAEQVSKMSLSSQMPRLVWDESADDEDNLRSVERLVSSALGNRRSIDTRVRNTLALAAEVFGLKQTERGRRKVVLSRGRKKLVVEHEDAPPSLERLHRLHISRTDAGAGAACQVVGDWPIQTVTREAVRWAGQGSRLQVHNVAGLYAAIERKFSGGGAS